MPATVLASSAPSSCDKVASPAGSDSAPGTAAAPLRTAQALTNALAPGQVGCLRAGTYLGGLTLNHGGHAGAPLLLRNYPGEAALITGRVYVPRGSDYVTVADLSLDGNYQSSENQTSPTINANHTTFESDDVTNDHTEICFAIGSASWGVADSTVLVGNHIHDCGRLPSDNQDHGIYIDDATNTHIVGNLIDHNTDRGIQLYPNASGTVITENVISENGEGIILSGDEGFASDNNTIEHNLIVKSQIRSDVESYYPPENPRGVGNVVQSNCISSRGINTEAGGFTAHANVTAPASDLIATGEGGYRAAVGSPCAAVLAGTAHATGVEGTPSGGAPTTVGKAVGGETPPAPSAPAEGTAPTSTAPTSTTGHTGAHTPSATTAARAAKALSAKRRAAARKARRSKKSAQASRAKQARAARLKRSHA